MFRRHARLALILTLVLPPLLIAQTLPAKVVEPEPITDESFLKAESQGAISFPSSVASNGNTRSAAIAKGNDASEKIAAAIAELPDTGGTVRAAFEGDQSWSVDPFSGVIKPVLVELAAGVTQIGADVTVPANVILRFDPGAVFEVRPGRMLSIRGPIQAGLYRIFADRRIVFGGSTNSSSTPAVLEVYPQWFGARCDGVTDDLAAIDNAMASTIGARVRIVGNCRVSGPVLLPNGVSLYGGHPGNTQNYDAITASGSLGFNGDVLLAAGNGGGKVVGAYNSFSDLNFNVIGITNPNFQVVAIRGLSESSIIRNIGFYLQDSSISRVFYFNAYGPIAIDTMNVVYPHGKTSILNEPIFISATNGLTFKNLNYLNTSQKGIYIVGGLFASLEGLQIESHSPRSSEPSLTIGCGNGISIRDSRFNTAFALSAGIELQMDKYPNNCGYVFENITFDTASGGSWDKLVTIKDNTGVTRHWDLTRLVTAKDAQLPVKIVRFDPSEQVFSGHFNNDGPRTFRETLLFTDVPVNGSITVPFNPRVLVGTYGTGFSMISINGRETQPTVGSGNSAVIFFTYADMAQAGLQAEFKPIVGSLETNWSATYASESIKLVNKSSKELAQVVVSVSHSTFNVWP